MQKIANFYVKVISGSFKTVKETIEQYLEGGKSQNIEYFDFWLKSVQYNEDDKMISNYSDVHADPYDYYSFLEDMVIELSKKCEDCKLDGWFKTEAGEWESEESYFTVDHGVITWEEDNSEEELEAAAVAELLSSGLTIEQIALATKLPEDTIRKYAETDFAEDDE